MQVHDIIEMMANSPIGWLGGKTKLRPTIINCMPVHHCYIEVFAGSASVFFGKPARLSKNEIINDIHRELVNLMKVISGTYFDKRVHKEFVGYVKNMPASRAAYEEWKNWGKKGNEHLLDKLTHAQRAFRFYYCVKKGFSSVPTGGYEASPLSKSRYNMNTDFDRFVNRFRATNAQIECLDFVKLIEKYNRASAKSFFFCDPPYFIADGTNYYDFVFEPADHIRLKESMDDVQKNKNTFLITYDDHPGVIDLYKDYYLYRTDDIVYSSSDERGERELIKRELFITNYDIAEAIHQRNTEIGKRRSGDLFAESTSDDDRIEISGHIGLTRI